MLFIAFYVLGWITGLVAVFTSGSFTINLSSVSRILLQSSLYYLRFLSNRLPCTTDIRSIRLQPSSNL